MTLELSEILHAAMAGLLACVLALAAMTARAAEIGVVTVLDGPATLLRGRLKWVLAEGVRLTDGDIVETGAAGRYLRIEFADGSRVGLGPDTAIELAPRLAAAPRLYLLRGWVKLAAESGPGAVAKRPSLAGPGFELGAVGGQVVVWVRADGAQAFAESGAARLRPLRPRPAAAVDLKEGESLTLAGDARPVLAERPSTAFIEAVPRPFQDSLPARAALYEGRSVVPKRVGEVGYADIRPWIDAEPALRRADLARWRPLAGRADIRAALIEGLKSHPEWRPILFPPPPPVPASDAVRGPPTEPASTR